MYPSRSGSLLGSFTNSHEDIIWAISQRHEWMRRNHKTEERVSRKRRGGSATTMKFQRDTRTQLMASMVPDEVITNVSDYTPKEYSGCLLCGDISGFTELLEICNEPGKGGPSRMTKALNDYIGAMVEKVMSFEGDVLKFSGNSFLALWKCPEKSSLGYYVHAAINCALVIQKKYGKYKTDDGIFLQVKLVVTAGPLIFSLIGDNVSSNYVCVGQPIDDIKEAEMKSVAGEILVAPSAWHHVNASEYLAVETEDGPHYKILGVGPNWRYGGKCYSNREENKQEIPENEDSDENLTRDYEIKVYQRTEDFTIRPIILKAMELQEDLSKFVISPVMHALNKEEPLDCLIEMRQVVVMFVNIVAKKCRPRVTVKIVDECYKIICNKAKAHKGVVNTVSLFNKDIVFVTVFGLRGFTNVLECREALKCSVRCQNQLQLIEEVQSVSIACTTGKSYCGVFGHMLRREYAVLSIYVSKAEKMMMAYPDKVTCDRQTFLYSKLEAKNFSLMDFKKLKGIPQTGPIYEYKEDVDEISTDKSAVKVGTRYPILGRDAEVESFMNLLETYLDNFGITPCCNHAKCTYKNCLIIEGNSKQGKSRLMSEFACKVGDLPVTRVKFLKDDHMSSYRGTRRMLGPTLRFGKYTLESYRRQTLKTLMKNDEFLCSFNNVFDVNFPLTDKYRLLSDEDKIKILWNNIKNLCFVCFTKPALIFIDNADFMDDESWSLIHPMLETKMFFLAVTLNVERRNIANLNKILKIHHIERMYLNRIAKIYQAGLACQILGVYAISADLENVIQSNSNGNPGWIENFLITLLQSKKIYKKLVDFKNIHECGLVAPPLYMLKRLDSDTIKQYKTLLEEKADGSKIPDVVPKIDQWEVYIDSCRDKFTDVDIRSQIHRIYCNETEIPVCFLSKNFSAAFDVDPEISEDMNVLELFDSISHQEQLVSRCASVLGDPFTRKILFYIWSPASQKAAADVICNLFEKRILCCAKGDFSEGGDYVLKREKMVDPSEDSSIECHCIGLDIHDSCLFMPKYASCGFMRFRSYKFRMTVYNIMTDAQKKEMHTRAAKFIQKETRRCIACGCSYFPPNPGCRLDSTPAGRISIKHKKRRKSLQLQQMGFQELFDYSTHYGMRSTITGGSSSRGRQSYAHNWMGSSIAKSYRASLSGDHMYGDEEYEARHARSLRIISPLTLTKLKNSLSLIRTFSKSNFMSCECHLILSHMYKRLKQHYRGSGQWHEMVTACIHYTKICLTSKNYASAMRTIKEAVDVLKNKEHLIPYPKWKIKMMFGKFACLQGIVLMNLDQVDEAHTKFLESLRNFGYPFPDRKNILFYLKLLKQKWKQRLALYFFPDSFVGADDNISQLYITNTISEALTYLCRIYISRDEWKRAELAAVWSLRNSLQTETSLIRICESFTNMMVVAQHYKNKLLWMSLEVHALRYCHKKRTFVEAPELRAVAQLYATIFEARMARAEFDSALHIAYILLHIATTSNDFASIIQLLALLVVILFEKIYLQEVIAIMHELEYYAHDLENDSGRLWYYSLSVVFHLETGYTFVPFHLIEMFYNGEGVNAIKKYYIARIRLIITMWVWYLRVGYWEAASIFKKDVDEYRKFRIDCNNHAITSLYLLEGTLLTLVNRINKRSVSGIGETKKEVEKLLKKLYKSASFAPFILGRVYHLEAYYAYIMDNEDKAKKFLKKAKHFCLKYEHKMELLHLEHSQKAWNNEITATIRDFWLNHCSNDTYVPYHEIEFDNPKVYFYTYPTPLFEN